MDGIKVKRNYTRENQQMDQLLFNLVVMYGGSYMFQEAK
jgi:hypothetical protein